jgi:hypothetical protein
MGLDRDSSGGGREEPLVAVGEVGRVDISAVASWDVIAGRLGSSKVDIRRRDANC